MPRHLFFSKEPSLLFDEPAEGTADASEAPEFKAPQWVHILPKPDKDGLIHSRDNRILHVDNLEALAKRSNAALKKQKGGGPVDADHRIYGWPGGGKALGWAEEFEARANGLWARTDWLDEGKDLIGNKLYRYTSSVVSGEMEPEIDEEAWSVTWHITPDIVEGFALTNIPALTTHALFSQLAQALPLGFAAPGEREEALQVLLRKMGLAANASPTDIREAWAAFSKKLAAASTSPAPAAPAGEPAPTPPAPAADPVADDAGTDDDADEAGEGDDEDDADDDGDAADDAAEDKPSGTVEEQLAAANAKIKVFQEEAGARYVDDLVHSGKMTPAQKPAALAQAKTEKGLQQLRALYQHAQPIITPSPNGPHARRSASSAAPPGVDPLAYELAGKKEPAHVIARRMKERDQKETTTP